MHATPNWPGPQTTPLAISHQGVVSDGKPGCSLPAFRAAYDLGCRFMETDLRATSDALVALHDVDAKVRGRKLAEVTRTDVEQSLGRPLADVGELLDAFPDVCWNFEVKNRRDAAALIRYLHGRRDVLGRVSVSWGPTWRVARLSRTFGPSDFHNAGSVDEIFRRWLASFGTAGMWRGNVPYRYAQYHHWMVRRPLINSLHKSGVAVHAWGVTDIDDAERLLRIGVDGIITDNRGVLARVVES